MAKAPLSAGDVHPDRLPARQSAHTVQARGAAATPASQGLRDTLGLFELPMVLVDLADFSVTMVTDVLLKRIGRTAESVLGHSVSELWAKEDQKASTTALEAMRSGVIDFFRAHRRVAPIEEFSVPLTVWARAVVVDERRFALSELSFGDTTNASPLSAFFGRPLGKVAIGTVDASWVITAISNEIFDLLECSADAVVGRVLLGAVEQSDVQPLLDADRMVTQEYSVARQIRMRDRAGAWRGLCCVLASVAGSASRCFILLPSPETIDLGAADRVRELEQHLTRIAAEVDASGILQRIGSVPDPGQLSMLSELSTRQWEVVTRLMQGQRVATIAAEMFVSQSTVRNHLSAIFERFGVHSQTELMARLHGR